MQCLGYTPSSTVYPAPLEEPHSSRTGSVQLYEGQGLQGEIITANSVSLERSGVTKEVNMSDPLIKAPLLISSEGWIRAKDCNSFGSLYAKRDISLARSGGDVVYTGARLKAEDCRIKEIYADTILLERVVANYVTVQGGEEKSAILPLASHDFHQPSEIQTLMAAGKVVVDSSKVENISCFPNQDIFLKIFGTKGAPSNIKEIDLSAADSVALLIGRNVNVTGSIFVPRGSRVTISTRANIASFPKVKQSL